LFLNIIIKFWVVNDLKTNEALSDDLNDKGSLNEYGWLNKISTTMRWSPHLYKELK
jgi:hypothetical protein